MYKMQQITGHFCGLRFMRMYFEAEALAFWRHMLLVYVPEMTRELVAVEPRRPLMTDVGTNTAFRLDQRKHFQKSKHLLRSEVS